MKNKSQTIKYFLILSLLLASLSGMQSSGQAWWQVYFTSPGNRAKSRNALPDYALKGIIKNAQTSIDAAFYDISSNTITAELINAKRRGVRVRLVTEKDNFKKKQVARLLHAGIPVVPDNTRGLMHHKFAIIDKSILWTGSYNITDNGSFKNNNNALMLNSPGLCKVYSAEFNEMFDQRIFGNRKEQGPLADITKKYHVKIGTTDINAYFSPEDNIERIILKRLKKAKKSIHFMAFSFTSDPIGEVMIQKCKQGVMVKGLFEKRGSGSSYSEFTKMKIEGLSVKTDKNRFAMHHKVIIIDDETVITGSYNFSKGANKRNDENILIIHNKEIAARYMTEFNRLYY